MKSIQLAPWLAVMAMIAGCASSHPTTRVTAERCIRSREQAISQASPASAHSYRYDSYEAALIDVVCRMAGDKYHFDDQLVHLRAILDQHPELASARRVFRGPRKPSIEDDFTPLHIAARHGDVEVARILVEHGADVNATTTGNENRAGGWTPLHYAAFSGSLPIAKLLVEHGANVDAKTDACPQMSSDDMGGQEGPSTEPATIFPAIPPRTALDIAQAEQNADVVRYLETLGKR